MSHFIRHYLEMVAAMFIGMGVLGMPVGMLVDDEALDLLVMATSMTIPMVAWMRYRGHSWRDLGGDERRHVRADRRGHRAAWARSPSTP